MGIYLTTPSPRRKAPNENLGRELLELHTVGRGNYDEDDVKDSARILTGWRVDVWKTWAAVLRRRRPRDRPGQGHGVQRRQRGDRRARPVTRALPALPGPAPRHRRSGSPASWRSSSCATTRRSRWSTTWPRSTSRTTPRIVPVLRALVASTAFAASPSAPRSATPVRTSSRRSGPSASRPQAGHARTPPPTRSCGRPPTSGPGPSAWPRPDGAPDRQRRRGPTASRLMAGSWTCTTRWPAAGGRRRARPTAVAEVVAAGEDAPVRRARRPPLPAALSRPATRPLLKACCQALGLGRRDEITRTTRSSSGRCPGCSPTLLDSPAHMTR